MEKNTPSTENQMERDINKITFPFFMENERGDFVVRIVKTPEGSFNTFILCVNRFDNCASNNYEAHLGSESIAKSFLSQKELKNSTMEKYLELLQKYNVNTNKIYKQFYKQ